MKPEDGYDKSWKNNKMTSNRKQLQGSDNNEVGPIIHTPSRAIGKQAMGVGQILCKEIM